MSFARATRLINASYNINNISLETVSSVRDLGVDTRYCKVIAAALRMLGYVRRVACKFDSPRALINSLYFAGSITAGVRFGHLVPVPRYFHLGARTGTA